jgi:hypothetical protein
MFQPKNKPYETGVPSNVTEFVPNLNKIFPDGSRVKVVEEQTKYSERKEDVTSPLRIISTHTAKSGNWIPVLMLIRPG